MAKLSGRRKRENTERVATKEATEKAESLTNLDVAELRDGEEKIVEKPETVELPKVVEKKEVEFKAIDKKFNQKVLGKCNICLSVVFLKDGVAVCSNANCIKSKVKK